LPLTHPQLITSVDALRQTVCSQRRAGLRIGLVPTMGALHEGHLSLVRASKQECDFTVVSIYVNPSQFGPAEDLARYPRMLQADLDALAGCGAEAVFAPADEQVYRPGHATWVEVGGVAESLEGRLRPGHFRGVATIVLKLFQMVQPDAAYFGWKDYQQLLVIRQMAADFDVPVEVRACPIVREPDGLAMSSRNAYLSPDARRRALALSQSLARAEALVAAGERDAERICREMRDVLQTAAPVEIDYIALVHPATLEPVAELAGPTAALLAARIDGTRLIDNTQLLPPHQ
jgi:pantoate--beta-alanine ligase